MIKLVIFDLDGTILDTLSDLSDSLNEILKRHNYPLVDKNIIKELIGNGLKKLLIDCLPKNTSKLEIDGLFNELIEYYKLHSLDKTIPYEGIVDLLKYLKLNDVKIAVASNKVDYEAKKLINHFFSNLIDVTYGETLNLKRKPAPDVINEIISLFNVKKNEVIYIGDTEVDYETARNASIKQILVSYGFRNKEFLEKLYKVNIVNSVEELKEVFKKII